MHDTRYDRQSRFPLVGEAGQQKIRSGRVLVVGMGALGSVVAELLARAGIGSLRIVDRDVVEWSNLQRQSLYTEADAREGLAKVHAASQHLAQINSQVEVQAVACDVTPANIEALVSGIDLIVDGTDNFETRFLINDAALETGIPWVHGGCVGASGQVFTFRPGVTICLRCLVRSIPDPATAATCDTVGVLGPATHQIASLQAFQAIKGIVLGAEAEADHHLLSMDLWEGRFRRIDTSTLQTPDCPACGAGRRDFLRGAAFRPSPIVLCGRNAVQLPPPMDGAPVDLSRIASAWQGLGRVHESRFLIRLDLPLAKSITLFRDGRAVVGGTEEPSEAKSLYARYVGQ